MAVVRLCIQILKTEVSLGEADTEVLVGEAEGDLIEAVQVPRGEAEGEPVAAVQVLLGEAAGEVPASKMDYLLSLVRKDQETITEAIKELAENAEKVKIKETEIDDLQSEMVEAKEEIHYLKTKLDQKFDIIDMELRLDKGQERRRDT